MTQQFDSRYPGTCNVCGGAIRVGDRICPWDGQQRVGKYAHTICPARREEEVGAAVDQLLGRLNVVVPSVVGKGTYTAVFGSEREYETIRLKVPGPQSTLKGRMIACLHAGSKFEGFGFVVGDRIEVWKRIERNAEHDADLRRRLRRALEAWEIVKLDPAGAGERYALESSNCWRCDKQLTVPASIHRGLGPDCAKKVA